MDAKEVIVSGVRMKLTDSLRAIVNEKVGKLFGYSQKIIRVRVSLEMSKNKAHEDEFIANGHIEIGGPDIKAHAASNDLYKSIDQMVAKLERQLVDMIKINNDKKKS